MTYEEHVATMGTEVAIEDLSAAQDTHADSVEALPRETRAWDALSESLLRWCAAGALVLAMAMPASAAKVPCPTTAPKGSVCYLVVKAPGQQCKGTTKKGKRCTRTVGVSKASGFCPMHKGQAPVK